MSRDNKVVIILCTDMVDGALRIEFLIQELLCYITVENASQIDGITTPQRHQVPRRT